jgi:hypothetical protein
MGNESSIGLIDGSTICAPSVAISLLEIGCWRCFESFWWIEGEVKLKEKTRTGPCTLTKLQVFQVAYQGS